MNADVTPKPSPPRALPPAAKSIWRRIVRSLPPGLLAGADLQLLEAFARAAAQKEAADLLVEAEGVVVGGRPHPALRASVQLAATMASLASKLRLTASSRTRPDAASLRDALAHPSALPARSGSVDDDVFA